MILVRCILVRIFLFRFKDDTTLEVMTNLTGDINTSNIELKDVTLLMKKIHE